MLRFSCGVIALFAGSVAISSAGPVTSTWFGSIMALPWGAVVAAATCTVLLALLGPSQIGPSRQLAEHIR